MIFSRFPTQAVFNSFLFDTIQCFIFSYLLLLLLFKNNRKNDLKYFLVEQRIFILELICATQKNLWRMHELKMIFLKIHIGIGTELNLILIILFRNSDFRLASCGAREKNQQISNVFSFYSKLNGDV